MLSMRMIVGSRSILLYCELTNDGNATVDNLRMLC